MAKRIIENSEAKKAQALAEYQNRKVTTQVIADNHGISTATLTVWAKKAGMKLRQRGRKKQDKPTARQMDIIRLASVYRYDQVGERFGMKKQSIHRIVKRWRSYSGGVLMRKAPFEPGDLLVWRGKRMIVIESNRDEGTLMDETTGKMLVNFPWNGGRMPKKIGINPRYAKRIAKAA